MEISIVTHLCPPIESDMKLFMIYHRYIHQLIKSTARREIDSYLSILMIIQKKVYSFPNNEEKQKIHNRSLSTALNVKKILIIFLTIEITITKIHSYVHLK